METVLFSYHRPRIIVVTLLATLIFAACSPSRVREAERVVAQADSLWHEGKMYGIDEGDSVTLVQAYGTLKAIPLPFTGEGLCPIGLPVAVRRTSSGLGSSYAHSCYHYGKLLRAKDDPVAAMQVFIDATHSHTKDYHILGRVYNNIGDICHLAGEYSLSYAMFEKSAEMFLRDHDTLSYCYCLNDMAFELASSNTPDSCFEIIEHVLSSNVIDSMLIGYCYLTIAETFLRNMQHDSAIHYSHKSKKYVSWLPQADIQLAQAFSSLDRKDSSVYYANFVMSNSTSPFLINNALYILTNNDEAKDKNAIRETAAYRADIQKLLSVRQGKLAQAVQLLEQDLNKKPDWLNYTLILCIIICIILSALFKRKWKHRKRQMQTQLISLTNKHTDSTIESIKKHIDITDINNTLHWKDYASMKADADLYMGGIVSKLEEKNLNEIEIRYCILTILDIPQKKKAEILHYGYPSGIKTLKRRTSIKLETTPPKLKQMLFSMAAYD